MNTETLILIIVVVGLVIAAGVAVWFASRKKSSQDLQEKFGSEYNYTVSKEGDQRAAEKALKEREKRVVKLDIRELSEIERERYHAEWNMIQADFVDDPAKSVEDANRLITEVMIARGFPVADFEQRAEDLSVMFPHFVPDFRSAHEIAIKNQQNSTSTEELRQAMVYYHSLYAELLGTVAVKEVIAKETEVAIP